MVRNQGVSHDPVVIHCDVRGKIGRVLDVCGGMHVLPLKNTQSVKVNTIENESVPFLSVVNLQSYTLTYKMCHYDMSVCSIYVSVIWAGVRFFELIF